MVMANYSEFSNNNYLPGFYNDMQTSTFSSFPSSPQFRSPVVSQNSFTFTSPTQCSTLLTHRPSIQTTSRISNLSAPGVGTSWQHSIPVTMPWGDLSSAGTTTVFTGAPLPSYPELNVSCDKPFRRPKRKALELADEAPMSKVYLCADQFANMKITQKEQSMFDQVKIDAEDRGVQVFIGAPGTQCRTDAEAWQRFREIEDRLDFELEEDVDFNVNNSNSWSEEGPRLKLAEGVLESAQTPSPILPRKVMEEITKPCMQIVLWKSPGELIREIQKDENPDTSDSDSNKISNSPSRLPLLSRDNIMEDSSDLTHTPSLSPHYQTDVFKLSTAHFLNSLPTNTVLSDRTENLNCNLIGKDSDIFDSMDDEMQL